MTERQAVLFHTVLFRFADETTPEIVEDVLDHLRAMSAIPAVRSVAVGPNLVPFGSDGWTHGMTLVFDSPEVMVGDFIPHPMHQAVLAEQLPLFERFIAMDVVSAAA